MVIGSHDTENGRSCQPNSVGNIPYRVKMFKKPPKDVLWENLQTLMNKKYGRENLGKLADDAGIGAATMTRLKKADNNPRLDTVAALAKAFKLEPWKLLVDGLKAEAPPELSTTPTAWPFPLVDKSRYEELDPEIKGWVQAELDRVITKAEEMRHGSTETRPDQSFEGGRKFG